MSTLASLLVLFRGDAHDLTRTMDHVEQRAGRMGGILNNVVGTAGGFIVANVAMRGFAMATDFAGDALIGYNARMEQAQIGFTTLLGSAEKATAFIKDLKTFAAKTPFDFPGLQKSANQMLAMGFNASEIIPTLTAVGDATAALGIGSEGVQRATYALGQMRAAGRVNAQDMMQLTSMGIPAWKMLADAMGKTVPEVRKLSEKGLIPAKQGLDAILNGIREGNMGGMMKEQAKTFNGSLATIQDTLMDLVSGALTPVFNRVRDVTVAFSNWVQGPEAAMIGTVIGGAVNVLEQAFGVLGKTIGPVFTMFMDAVSTIGRIGAGFQSIGRSLGFGPALQSIGATVGTMSDKFWDFVDGLVPKLVGAFNEFTKKLPGMLSTALDTILAFADTAVATFMDMAGRAIESFAAAAPQFAAAIGTFLQTGFDWLINEGVPKAAAAIGPLALKFIDWVFEMLPKLLDALDEIILTIINFIITNAPVLALKLVEWAIAFAGFIITEVIPRLIKNLPTILRTILFFIAGAASKLIGKMAELGVGMVAGVVGILMRLPGRIGALFLQVLGRVANFVATLIRRAAEGGSQFVSRIVNSITSLPGKAWSGFLLVLGKVGDFIRRLGQMALEAGAAFVRKIVTGLTRLPGALWNAITGAIKSILPIKLGPFTIGLHGIWVNAGPVSQQLASFAAGTGRTTAGLAYLHDDEAVLPKHVADWFRRNGFPTVSGGMVAAGAGGININIDIGTFYGTDDNIDRLGSGLAKDIRRTQLRDE